MFSPSSRASSRGLMPASEPPPRAAGSSRRLLRQSCEEPIWARQMAASALSPRTPVFRRAADGGDHGLLEFPPLARIASRSEDESPPRPCKVPSSSICREPDAVGQASDPAPVTAHEREMRRLPAPPEVSLALIDSPPGRRADSKASRRKKPCGRLAFRPRSTPGRRRVRSRNYLRRPFRPGPRVLAPKHSRGGRAISGICEPSGEIDAEPEIRGRLIDRSRRRPAPARSSRPQASRSPASRSASRRAAAPACPIRSISPTLSRPDDEVIADQGVNILIAPKDLMFLLGTKLDFEADKFASSFTFKNSQPDRGLRLRRIGFDHARSRGLSPASLPQRRILPARLRLADASGGGASLGFRDADATVFASRSSSSDRCREHLILIGLHIVFFGGQLGDGRPLRKFKRAVIAGAGFDEAARDVEIIQDMLGEAHAFFAARNYFGR